MRRIALLRRLAITVLALAWFPGSVTHAGTLALWYDKPAADWEREGLPIGNGAMGAVITGNIDEDRIQFNEKTLWTGGPGSRAGYDFGLPLRDLRGAIAQLRTRIAKEGQVAPEEAARILGRKAKGYGDYQSFGEVVLASDDTGATTDYRRSLDIANAVAQVQFARGDVTYKRTYFADYPDRVIVVRLEAGRPGAIGLRVSLAIPPNRSLRLSGHDGRITAAGALDDNGLKYEAALQILAQGGTRADQPDGTVRIAGADSVTLILAAGTNYAPRYPAYRGPDPHRDVQQRLDAAARKGFDGLLATHLRDYHALFGRVTLDIGQGMPEAPTDKLLAAYRTDAAADARALEALYFQYGRYLLIASSRAGSLPANLQGVWNHSATPPWDADYHLNINLQMNYWPADVTNLGETAAPLYGFVDALMPPGRESARRIFRSKGWVAFLNTNPFGYSGLIDWPTAFWQPEAAAWLATQYYDHYRFTQDRAFLARRAYPAMKAAAAFWLANLVPDPRDGKLDVSPSYSPEHGPFSAGAAMSEQIVDQLLRDTIEAGRLLHDDTFVRRARPVLARLDPGLRIGSWGQLREWKDDWDDKADQHRHVSHLFALYPGDSISPRATPALAEAARVTLGARGDAGTGWSRAWKINFWARLHDGDHAFTLLSGQLADSTLPNLWDTHPPFQIDGNFGATAGIAEMLLQSTGDVIDLLPALPSAWPEGSITGLRARGAVTVDLCWSGGALVAARITPDRARRLQLRLGDSADAFAVRDAASQVPLSHAGEVGTFLGKAGQVYLLRRSNAAPSAACSGPAWHF